MKPLPRDASGYGFGHLCCEGRSFAELDRDEPVRRLERAVGLRAVPQGAVVGGLPRGATVQVIGSFDSELLVVHTGKLAGRGWTGVSVRAWVPADALSGRQPSPSLIRGRLSYPEAIGSEVLADVYARTSHRQWVRGRVLTDGAFEVPVLYEQESIEIKAIARDRAWLGAFEPLWRGKDFVLHMQRARELAATVVTSEGNPIPNVSIRLHPRSYRDMPSARTDAQGMFVLRAFPEEQDMLLLSAPGFLEHDFFLKGSLPPRIVLRRASLIAGAVGRDARGACLGREIYAEGREIAVADDCTFVVERTWEGVTTINGRWQPRQHVTLDYKGEQPYAQSCDPDATGGVGSPTLRCDVEGDVTDVCLGEHCASDKRASVFVRVLGADGALVPETRVEVFAAERKLGECVAKSGACFVHGLQPKLAVEVRARMAERMLRGATTTSATTVREVSLR